jgi:YD repeat-containing protein
MSRSFFKAWLRRFEIGSLEEEIMKVSYDARTDTLSVIFMEDATVAESDEEKRGVILDYDEQGNLVSLEILDASQRVTQTNKIEFEAVEASVA